MEKKKLQPELQIVELFLVKPWNDYSRTFIGQISRETTREGISIVRGSVEVTDGKLWSFAESDYELGKYLDALCTMKLDYYLHEDAGKKVNISGFEYFLN